MSRATKHHKTNAVIDGLIRRSTLEHPFTMKGLLEHPDIIAIDPPRWMVNERIKAFKHKKQLESVSGAGVPRGSYYFAGGVDEDAAVGDSEEQSDKTVPVATHERDSDATSVASGVTYDASKALSSEYVPSPQLKSCDGSHVPTSGAVGIGEISDHSDANEETQRIIIQELQAKNDEMRAKIQRLEADLRALSTANPGKSVAVAPIAVETVVEGENPDVRGEENVAEEGSQTRLTFEFGSVRVTMEQVTFSQGAGSIAVPVVAHDSP